MPWSPGPYLSFSFIGGKTLSEAEIGTTSHVLPSPAIPPLPKDAKPRQVVEWLLSKGYRLVFWPATGDSKGPREEGWTTKQYTIDDYKDGYRVGVMLGTELDGFFLVDFDIDWAPGLPIALKCLPTSDFIYGRSSKKISHIFYSTPKPMKSMRFEDIDGTCLLEIRGTKANGDIGLQTMVPPSVWSKEGKTEQLTPVRFDGPTKQENEDAQRCAIITAIGMILAKNLGHNGFGHPVRLAWAGFLLRSGVSVGELIAMGEGMSVVCNNKETHDVRLVVEGTAARMQDKKQHIQGGPTLVTHLGAEGKKILQRINEWLGRETDYIRNEKGAIVKDHQENIRRAFEHFEIELGYDGFSEHHVIKGAQNLALAGLNLACKDWQPLVDSTLTGLWLRIDNDLHFRPNMEFFTAVTFNTAHQNTFHPVVDYLSRLTWDGVPRIETWLADTAGVKDSEYFRTISSLVLLAAVRRVRQPGCKFDEMLVIESEQGLNKSTALASLCPNPEWFSDDLPLNIDAKQIIERTKGKWIIEASDLAGKRRADLEHLKASLSRRVDGPVRMAYARIPVERARQFIIIGTTNDEKYLADPTGARRFWPVKVQRFDIAKLISIREQLWAEAAAKEAAGVSIRLPEHLWAIASKHQEERHEADAWEEIIRDWLETIERRGATGQRAVATDQIWEALGIEVKQRDTRGARRIADSMRRLGWMRTRVRINKSVKVGFIDKPAKQPILPGAIDEETIEVSGDDD